MTQPSYLSLFTDPFFVQGVGVPWLLAGLAPTEELGEAATTLGAAIGQEAPGYSETYTRVLVELKGLLRGGGPPHRFRGAQNRLAQVLEAVGSERQERILEATGWRQKVEQEPILASERTVREKMIRALRGVDAQAGQGVDRLSQLVPTQTTVGETHALTQSAADIMNLLLGSGFQSVERLDEINVYGRYQRDIDPNKPTVLFYTHHDVVSNPNGAWTVTQPFEPFIHSGRLYGKGTADGKGPLIALLSALRVFHWIGEEPSVNVTIYVSGKGQAKSPQFAEHLRQQPVREMPYAIVSLTNDSISDQAPTIVEPTLSYRWDIGPVLREAFALGYGVAPEEEDPRNVRLSTLGEELSSYLLEVGIFSIGITGPQNKRGRGDENIGIRDLFSAARSIAASLALIGGVEVSRF